MKRTSGRDPLAPGDISAAANTVEAVALFVGNPFVEDENAKPVGFGKLHPPTRFSNIRVVTLHRKSNETMLQQVTCLRSLTHEHYVEVRSLTEQSRLEVRLRATETLD